MMERWKEAMERAHNKEGEMETWTYVQITHMINFHDIVPSRKWYKADEVDNRIQELEKENEKLDTECTKRQLEIYRLEEKNKRLHKTNTILQANLEMREEELASCIEALEEIEALGTIECEKMANIATEALKEGEDG